MRLAIIELALFHCYRASPAFRLPCRYKIKLGLKDKQKNELVLEKFMFGITIISENEFRIYDGQDLGPVQRTGFDERFTNCLACK